MFETFFAKLAGKWAAKKLNLQEANNMDETKKWYQSRNLWTGVVTAIMGVYLSMAQQFHLPAVPEWIFAILGAIGVYTRVTTTAKIE